MCYFTIIVFNGTIECMSNVITLKLTQAQEAKLYEAWSENAKTPPQYAKWQLRCENCVITCYTSGKTVFQGKEANVYASPFMDEELIQPKLALKDILPQAGSDEVGTGDYFGPIVVTATFVSKEDIPFLEKLGVGDSKKIDDSKILKIAPEIAKKIKYKSVILSNREYNENYTKDINMNKIKAILHNRVLYQLVNEVRPKYDYIIVDEFAREARYYDYIKDQKVIQRNITFMTKAEDKNMAVACGSIISRYIFLKEFDKLCDSIHIPLPKGAGKDVDSIGEEVVEKYGEEKLKDIAKLNFKNTERILHTMIY